MPVSPPMTLAEALTAFSSAKAAEGKTSTVRKISFCLRKLESFPPVQLADISRSWVESFTDSLIGEGLAPNTAATYLRLIYSACRAAARSGADVDLDAFTPADMVNRPAASPERILQPLQALAADDFRDSESLARARAAYLASFTLGGIPFERLLTLTRKEIMADAIDVGGRSVPLPALTRTLLLDAAFPDSRYLLRESDADLTPDAIARRRRQLDGCLAKIGLRLGFEGRYSYDEIPSLHARLAGMSGGDPRRLLAPLAAAAPRWFAIHSVCRDSAPLLQLLSVDFPTASLFTPEIDSWQRTDKGVKHYKSQILNRIIFVHAPVSTARRMRSDIRDYAYVYTRRDGDAREVAVIPDRDMKMFLYFNDIAPEEIGWYVEEEKQQLTILPDTRVTVTAGRWQGAGGLVVDAPAPEPGQVMVAIEFANLGITATCPVPLDFLEITRES